MKNTGLTCRLTWTSTTKTALVDDHSHFHRKDKILSKSAKEFCLKPKVSPALEQHSLDRWDRSVCTRTRRREKYGGGLERLTIRCIQHSLWNMADAVRHMVKHFVPAVDKTKGKKGIYQWYSSVSLNNCPRLMSNSISPIAFWWATHLWFERHK